MSRLALNTGGETKTLITSQLWTNTGNYKKANQQKQKMQTRKYIQCLQNQFFFGGDLTFLKHVFETNQCFFL